MNNPHVKTFSRADVDALLDLHRSWLQQYKTMKYCMVAALAVQIGLPMKSTFTLLEAHGRIKHGTWDRVVDGGLSAKKLREAGAAWLAEAKP